ncbi:MAG: hypothetical protein AB1861_08860 [Cyanobacteriota bacterium]
MMPRKKTSIDVFAEILIEEKLDKCERPCPGEMAYVAIASKLIQERLREYYQSAGVKPPRTSTVRNWFYGKCPDWAIAVLYNTLGAKSGRKLVAR